MFSYMLTNSYINFVGFLLLGITYPIIKRIEDTYLLNFILTTGLFTSLGIYLFIAVPLLDLTFTHFIAPLFLYCYHFWF